MKDEKEERREGDGEGILNEGEGDDVRQKNKWRKGCKQGLERQEERGNDLDNYKEEEERKTRISIGMGQNINEQE